MKSQKEIEIFKKLINRQRIHPKIWDFFYLSLRNNIQVFKQFRDLVIREKRSRILDVGCGFKPWLELFGKSSVEYVGVDFDKESSSADFIASADKLPFPDNNFDALIYSEVLEHVQDLPAAIKEMHRVAKNGALVFISTPFVFPEHGAPYDFQRPTRFFYQNIFKNDEIIILRESNSSFSTVLVSLNLSIESIPFKIKIFKGIKYFVYAINNVLSILVDAIIKFIFLKKQGLRRYFYLMPLGFTLIARIKK